MSRATEFIAGRLTPALSAERPELFSELRGFFRFLRDELRPFPGRGQTVVRLVVCAVVATILCQALRIQFPAYPAYLVFFIANENGITSVRVGLLAMIGATIAIATASWISICFDDAPWFRLPATLLLIGLAVWLSRALVLGVIGVLIAVVLALYLSIADTVSDPETLTETTLWLWSVVGITVGVSALVSVLLEPRPDLLLRALAEAALGKVEQALGALASGGGDRLALAKSLRREVYGTPQRMRQLHARWRQRAWPKSYADIDWTLAIFIIQRLLSVTAALAALEKPPADDRVRRALAEFAGMIGELKRAAHERNVAAIRSLAVPSLEAVPAGDEKGALIELAAVLDDLPLLNAPAAAPEESPEPPAPKLWALVPDALTNPEHLRFAIKVTLAIFSCEIFMNAVDWPGIHTCMITCVVTALATAGAQRQKQLLRLTGVTVGGLMGLGAILCIVPRLDTIVGLSLLVAAGAAICAWVAAGSVRSSYAGFQMALAFFMMLLPDFSTSIDLTAIRDRFVGIVTGIVAMWIFLDHLWHTSSRRQLMDKLVAILQRQAQGPGIVSPALEPAEARRRVMDFRGELINDLHQGRLLVDETKIELTLSLEPKGVRGDHLEIAARDVSFAGFLLLALNERKLRLLAAHGLAGVQPLLHPADEALMRNFTALAGAFRHFQEAMTRAAPTATADVTFPPVELAPVRPAEPERVAPELRSLYEALDTTTHRIADLGAIARGLE